MAGYRVVWANEFVPAAQASYKANASEHCTLDCRDIKLVLADDIFKATGLKQGELDLFDGSPPCQAFSTAGKREKGWGKKKSYEHGATQCNEQLFTQYIRLLRDLQPRAFVAENVSGLVKVTAKGFFLEILRDLKACGYQVKCKVLDAQWLGVPQKRQRTIFVGVRNDIDLPPAHPKPLSYRYSVRDALPCITECGTGPSFADWKSMKRDPLKTFQPSSTGPCQSVLASGVSQGVGMCGDGTERRKFTIAELRRICAFPDDFILKGSYAQQWERLGNSVPPVMMQHIAAEIRDKVLRP
jgi:DNA (cytosine-5)-methyltransferase 1